MNQKQVRIGVGVVIHRDGHVLLGQRAGAHGAGSWALPGGHLDFGETIAQCAIRETREETGLLIDTVESFAFTENLFPDQQRHYVTIFVRASGYRGVPFNREPEKCSGWDWFAEDALPTPLFAPLHSLLENGYALLA